jgi:predicted TIM-barrel enzyme
MGASTATLAGAGMATASFIKANNDQHKYEKEQKTQQAILDGLIANRQEVFNPMANLTNEAEKVGVATQAAQFQAEQADMALASTLDTIMATGSGAGGATALAQMALQSKQGISADIQKQELQNAKNVANTQMAIDQQKAEGASYAWEQQEIRQLQDLDRTQNLVDKAEAQAFNAEAQKWEAAGAGVESVVGGIGNMSAAMGQKKQMKMLEDALSEFDFNGEGGGDIISLLAQLGLG